MVSRSYESTTHDHAGGPPGEANRVIQIKLICDIGIVCAKNFAEAPPWREPGFLNDQRRRYQEKKLQAIQLTRLLSDSTYRDLALRYIITLCIAANERSDAKKLFAMLQSEDVQNDVLDVFPQLTPDVDI